MGYAASFASPRLQVCRCRVSPIRTSSSCCATAWSQHTNLINLQYESTTANFNSFERDVVELNAKWHEGKMVDIRVWNDEVKRDYSWLCCIWQDIVAEWLRFDTGKAQSLANSMQNGMSKWHMEKRQFIGNRRSLLYLKHQLAQVFQLSVSFCRREQLCKRLHDIDHFEPNQYSSS